MVNILVNGLKSKVGGGKVIFDTYLALLKSSDATDMYYILTPDRSSYEWVNTDRIKLIDVPAWAHNNIATIPLYRWLMPQIISKYDIGAILNFGDIIIPTDIPQVYNFDWAFAVYPDHMSWRRLSWSERLLYRVKLHFFEAYLDRATVVMAQTDAMKKRLEARYDLDNVVLVPAAVSPATVPASDGAAAGRKFNLPKATTTLVYPANYYPHKNIEVLEPVAEMLAAANLDIVIVTTLAPDEHDGARAFLDRIAARGLGRILVNVGRVPAIDMPQLYDASDGLLMPTLLETFGLPYVEAMQHQKPILTSDLDFARAVCGDAAAYFDPIDPASIASAIEHVFGNDTVRAALIENGRRRLASMWDWPRVFAAYQAHLAACCRGSATQIFTPGAG